MKPDGWRWYPRSACLFFFIAHGVLAVMRLLSVITFTNPLWLNVMMLVAGAWVVFDGLVLERRSREPDA